MPGGNYVDMRVTTFKCCYATITRSYVYVEGVASETRE